MIVLCFWNLFIPTKRQRRQEQEKLFIIYIFLHLKWYFTTIHKTPRHDINRILNNVFHKCLGLCVPMCLWNWKTKKIKLFKVGDNQTTIAHISYMLSWGVCLLWNTCALSLEDINICPYLNKYQSIKLMNYPQQKMSWFLVAWVVAFLFFAGFLLQIFFQRLSPNWLIVQLCYETIFSGFLLFKQRTNN